MFYTFMEERLENVPELDDLVKSQTGLYLRISANKFIGIHSLSVYLYEPSSSNTFLKDKIYYNLEDIELDNAATKDLLKTMESQGKNYRDNDYMSVPRYTDGYLVYDKDGKSYKARRSNIVTESYVRAARLIGENYCRILLINTGDGDASIEAFDKDIVLEGYLAFHDNDYVYESSYDFYYIGYPPFRITTMDYVYEQIEDYKNYYKVNKISELDDIYKFAKIKEYCLKYNLD